MEKKSPRAGCSAKARNGNPIKAIRQSEEEKAIGNPKSIALVGATASGKSAVAIQLARIMNAEIVSVDSMQVYRGLDIGTAKPSLQERAQIRHHLIDILDVHEVFSAHRFCELAQAAASSILSQDKIPLFCGGTGFYLKALIGGLGTAPPADPGLRAALEAKELPVLIRDLNAIDPEAASVIDLRNKRRLIRAIEIIRVSGRTLLSNRAEWRKGSMANACVDNNFHPIMIIGLCRDRADLWNRINRRAEAMINNGLEGEVRRFMVDGLPENPTISRALGYRQMLEYLKGTTSLEKTLDQIKAATRHYAKKQMTWFRHQLSVHWISLPSEEPPDASAYRIVNALILKEPSA